MWDHGYDDYPALEKSMFGSAKLTKNTDIDVYKYSGYGIEFDRHGTFLVTGGFGRNVLIFCVDMQCHIQMYFGTI